jgi:hypothetical protein
VWRPDVARRRPIGEILANKKPAAKFFARARQSLDDATMPVICPTSQICNLRRINDKARCRFLNDAGRMIFAMMSMCA